MCYQGFERISYELDNDISDKNFETFLCHSEDIFQWYIEQILQEKYFDFRNITRVMVPILLKFRSKSHCNAGVGYMAVSADGQLYPCHRFIGEQQCSRGYISSLSAEDIKVGINAFDRALRSGPADRHVECVQCAFKLLCGGMCPYQAYVQHGQMFAYVEKTCRFKRMLFDQALRLLCLLKGEKLQDFIKYLTNIWQQENRTGGFIPPDF